MTRRALPFLAAIAIVALFPRLGPADAGPAAQPSASSADISGVVELFTSQGCSSCVSAAKVFSALAADPKLVALAYHVDYWDYIGWTDTYGSPANTERQRSYAKAFGTGTIYTPQIVVNGQADVIGSHENEVRGALASNRLRASEQTAGASIELSLDNDHVHISADAKAERPDGRKPVLMLVTFDSQTSTLIDRGENKDTNFVNDNAVRDWRVLGMWAGKPLAVDIPVSTLQGPDGRASGCAVLLQSVTEDGAPGPILAAAVLRF